MSELDNPVWGALVGPQRNLGKATDLAARFDPEVSPFGGFSDDPSPEHWWDMAALAGPQGTVALTGITGVPPSGWTALREMPGVQMVWDRPAPDIGNAIAHQPNGAPVALDEGDVGDMLALVAVAQPGPFLARTVEFGGYVGISRHGQLVAMAGQRLRPPGYTEISAVATHPDHQRQGLGELLVLDLVTSILGRGEVPFLHASADNAGAIRLYERLGFSHRRNVSFLVAQAP